MKTKFAIAALLIVVITVFASCATQKYGCPGNPQATTRFRA